MQQLITLNKGTYAVDLYLKRRSAALRVSVRELQVSEEPLFYVRKLSTLIVNDIVEVRKEFLGRSEYYPLILQWSSREMSILISLVRLHVIDASPTLTVLAHTWRILMGKCQILASNGIDLSFEINSLATSSLKMALESNLNNIVGSLRLKILDERWTPFSLENDQNLNRFLEEMSDLGLSLDWAISKNSSRKWCLDLSQNACNFSKMVIVISRDLEVITTHTLLPTLNNFIKLIWSEYLEHLNASLTNSEVYINSVKLIFFQVVPLCDHCYRDDIVASLVLKKFPSFSQYLKIDEMHTFVDNEIATV